jgi:hypothetical protein
MMKQGRILIQRIISPDGNKFAEAKSIALSSGESNSTISQTVTVKISDQNLSSSSSSSSATSFSSLSHS